MKKEFGRIFLPEAKKPGCGTLSRSTAPIPHKPLRGLLRDFRFNPGCMGEQKFCEAKFRPAPCAAQGLWQHGRLLSQG
jgi:hypothetical protein